MKSLPNRYIAFLRGINVNGRIIKNTDLHRCFEKMGFKDVKVVLQSGNVIFHSPADDPAPLKEIVEAGLEKQFTYPAKVIIVDTPALEKIVEKYPFKLGAEDQQYYVIFVSNEITPKSICDSYEGDAEEDIAPGKHVIYARVKKGQTVDSPFGKFMAKAKYRDTTTTRNLNTIRKLIG